MVILTSFRRAAQKRECVLFNEQVNFCTVTLSDLSCSSSFPAAIMLIMQSSTSEFTMLYFVIMFLPGENLREIFLRLSVGDLSLRFNVFILICLYLCVGPIYFAESEEYIEFLFYSMSFYSFIFTYEPFLFRRREIYRVSILYEVFYSSSFIQRIYSEF